jgi:DNA-binding transcriptional LysR family regulator
MTNVDHWNSPASSAKLRACRQVIETPYIYDQPANREELEAADSELTSSSLRVSGLVRISVASTFGRLHVLPLIPELLSLYPDLKVDFVLSDLVRDMVEDRIDLAIRVGPVDELDAVVRRVASTPRVRRFSPLL